MTKLSQALKLRYPHAEYLGVDLRSELEELFAAHVTAGLGDRNTEARLCAADDATYWQQFSEVLLARELTKLGIVLTHPRVGPDFVFVHEGRKIWIEVITPTPEGVPSQWLKRNVHEAMSLPHQEILLRWTAAIKEKAEKLLGNQLRKTKGYIQKKIVSPEDAYVIAVNGYLLRHPPFPQVLGISQYPFAVEAVFPVGPIEVRIDVQTMETVSVAHQYRPLIPKSAGRDVPATMFLESQFKAVSAIFATDINENVMFGFSCPMVLVHNPGALNPIPEKLLPAQSEYVAVREGDQYVLETRDGCLAERSKT